jgi:hypothetical protein
MFLLKWVLTSEIYIVLVRYVIGFYLLFLPHTCVLQFFYTYLQQPLYFHNHVTTTHFFTHHASTRPNLSRQ